MEIGVTTSLPGTNALPLHVQLRQALEAGIREGRLKAGSALPQERDLSLQFGISRVTVRRALKDLESRRMVRRVRGKGTFVLDDDERVRAALIAVSVFSYQHQSLHFAGVDSVLREHHRFPVALNYGIDRVDDEARIVRQIIEQNVAGLLISPTFTVEGEYRDNSDLLAQIVRSGKPVVTMDRVLPTHKVSAVVFDHPACETSAVQWLARRGVQRVGYLGLGKGFLGQAKFRAMNEEAQRHPLDWQAQRDSRLSQDNESFWPERFGASAAVDLFRQQPDIEALVCYSSDVLSSALGAIREAGLGGKLRMVLCSWSTESRLPEPELFQGLEAMVATRDAFSIGAEAASLLMSQLVDGVPEEPVIKRRRPMLIPYDEAYQSRRVYHPLDGHSTSIGLGLARVGQVSPI